MNSTSHCFKFQGGRTSYLNPRYITKRLRWIPNARYFRFDSALVYVVLWLKCGGLRCSPRNTASFLKEILWNSSVLLILT